MGGKSRDRIYGPRIGAAKMRLQHAKDDLQRARQEVDRAACRLWSEQMEGYGGPAQPSPTIRQALHAGYVFLKVKCKRCDQFGAVDLSTINRSSDTPIWMLEASLGCQECKMAKRWKSHAFMVKLMEVNEVELEKHSQWYPPGQDR